MSEYERHHRPEDERKIELGREIIIFMGPEGSGKTTLGRKLASASGKPFITVSDILREVAANDQSEYGNECRAMFAEHRYLDSKMLLDILGYRFGQADLEEGFILDGGLRTVEGVLGFQNMLRKAGRSMPLTVVNLRLPAWMSVQRLVTGTNARKRVDDTTEGILSRLSRFYTDLGKRTTLMHQQEKWKILLVNATKSIDETYEKVLQEILDKNRTR